MAAAYVEKHRLALTIEKAISEALISQPENPYLALADWFAAGKAKTVPAPKPKASGAASSKPVPIKEAKEAMLDIGGGISLWYRTWGSPTGIPVIFVHGGPGNSVGD